MNDSAQKKRLSTGAKWGLGCGFGCLTMLVLLTVAAFFGYQYVTRKLAEMTREMKQLGFERVETHQAVEVRNTIVSPTLYIGQMVKVVGDCNTNLAIIAQVAEIHGRVAGKVYFRGQVLTIEQKAELLGGLDATAQVINQHGVVRGGITGKYQVVNNRSAQQVER